MLRRAQHILRLFFLVLLIGCAGAPIRPDIPMLEDEYSLSRLTKNKGIEYGLDSISQSFYLSRGKGTAKGLIGSDIVILNDAQIVLSAPIKFENGSIIVPRDFKAKIIDRLVAEIDTSRLYRVQKLRFVVLDAGHGGKDPGAIGRSGLYEKTVVLDITRRVKKILESKGIKVIMTRDKDEFIPLKDRTVIASKAKGDLFVSIHANAHARRSINGIEVYTLRDLDRLEKNEPQRKENHETLFKELKMRNNDKELKAILSDMLYNYKQAESLKLADNTSEKLARFIKAKNLGQKDSRFYVLRNTLTPAILVEVGYLTNPKEEKFLKTKAYRQKIAYALSRSILDYANSQ